MAAVLIVQDEEEADEFRSEPGPEGVEDEGLLEEIPDGEKNR